MDGSTTQVVTGQKATTTNAKNEKFVVYTNLDGNATKIEFVDASGNSSTLVENYYDAFGNLTNTNDNCAQNQISCNYDEFGRLTEKLYSQNNVAITLKNTYDRYGNVSGASIKIGETTCTYENTFDYSSPQTLHLSTKINNIIESYSYDKLSRISETKLGNIYSKHFNYLQKGGCTSNLIASEWFGCKGIVADSLKYRYDDKGNITHILENGKEIARFTYDGIARLVREDNAKLGKTTLFDYDCGGNKLDKSMYKHFLLWVKIIECYT